MLQLIVEQSFLKDKKALVKKHYNFSNLETVVKLLLDEQSLPGKYHNHHLSGNWQGYYECHLEKDMLLIYTICQQNLYLIRPGTHHDLFSK